MTRKTLILIFIGIIILGLTGCGKKSEGFTIICERNDTDTASKQTNKAVYNFGKDQYLTDYEIETISTYKDKETYKIYKEAALETAKSNKGASITYNVSNDDKTKTVTLEYNVILDKNDLEEHDDKEFYKAASVLKRVKQNSNVKCNFKGITENQIK